ncbi:MAG: hypothetical protein QME64_08380, partial [bacterium]|nr:hypothetical protein [bacterium]
MTSKPTNYDEYVKNNRITTVLRLARIRNSFTKRIPRQKPRDPIEEKLLLQSTHIRRNRLIQTQDWI